MKTSRILMPALIAAVLTISGSGANANPPMETTPRIIKSSFVEQDAQKEEDILKASAERIEAKRKAAQLEQERKEAERVAQEAEKIRIAEENARIESERVEAEEAERVRILAEQESERVRIEAENARIAEEDRLRREAEKVVAQTPPPTPVAPPQSGEEWIQTTMASYGVYAAPGTTFLITDVDNCGGPGGGCTSLLRSGQTGKIIHGKTVIRISPSAIGDVHLLFHEIAHSHDIMDECEAEHWAHNVTNNYTTYSYPHCF